MDKNIVISILVAGAIIAGSVMLARDGSQAGNTAPANNVFVADGKQIIEIKAKGGYFPGKSSAKAGIPTVLRFNTAGTFDCSSSVRIPSMNISKFLPQSGSADIDLGSPEAGILRGSCGMGMYPFEIDFQK